MGKPMAGNLLKAGFDVVVQSRSQGSVDEVVSNGASSAGSPKEVAEQCGVVITMLPDSPDVEVVVSGENGLLDGFGQGSMIIDMSTISPVVTRRLADVAAKKGVKMLDAPVSGGDKGAIAGTLSIMAGGDAEDFEKAKPFFEVLGKTIVHCGPVGAGQTVKACNQVVVAIVLEAISEAFVLGSKAGVDPKIILEVLSGGLAQTRAMDLRGPTMIEHNFEPGFRSRLHRKDMNIIMQTAKEYGAVLPVSALVDQMFTTLVETGKGDSDHSALLTVIEGLSDHSIFTERSNEA